MKQKIKGKEIGGNIVKQVLQSIMGDNRISIEDIDRAGGYLAKVIKETTREEK